MTTEQNKMLARRVWDEIWHRGNLDVMDSLFAADFVRHDPNGRVLKGVDQNRQFIASMRQAFPDLHYAVDDEIADGDKVVVRYRFTGTHQGPFQGAPATGKPVSYTGILIYRFAEGRIAEQWTEADLLSFLQQLGVVQVRLMGSHFGGLAGTIRCKAALCPLHL
jgi:steroid delta-isomerase-like uncharacterized protein